MRLDRLQALISTSCIEHLEFGRDEDADRALQHRLMYVACNNTYFTVRSIHDTCNVMTCAFSTNNTLTVA